MAAPIASSVRIPDDSGNTGPRVQTQRETIGGEEVHAHFFIKRAQAKVLGVYRLSTALQSVQASAHNGTSTAFAWLHVPTAISGKSVRIRQARAEFNNIGVTSMPTVPRVSLARFTFTGTASGATIAGAKLSAAFPTPVLDTRSAVTGLTVTLDPTPGSLLASVLTPAGLLAGTATSFAPHPSIVQWLLDGSQTEDEYIVLAPGEGVVLYQPDAGTASDSRRFIANFLWDEIDTAA